MAFCGPNRVPSASSVIGGTKTAEIQRKSKKSRLSRAKCHYSVQRIDLLSGGDSAQHVGVHDGACAVQKRRPQKGRQNVVVILLRSKGVNRLASHFIAHFACQSSDRALHCAVNVSMKWLPNTQCNLRVTEMSQSLRSAVNCPAEEPVKALLHCTTKQHTRCAAKWRVKCTAKCHRAWSCSTTTPPRRPNGDVDLA